MTRSIATLAAALVLALAGCGGDDESGSGGGGGGGGGETLQLAAPEDGSLRFEPSTLEANAGTVTIDFDNPSSVEHAVEIEGQGVEEASDTVTDAKTSVSADLEAGTYTIYCPVEGHREAGMEGTLTVK
jgi:plastocyanin